MVLLGVSLGYIAADASVEVGTTLVWMQMWTWMAWAIATIGRLVEAAAGYGGVEPVGKEA